jgi:hypothetical protein
VKTVFSFQFSEKEKASLIGLMTVMKVIPGFDPGDKGAFGWAVCNDMS